MHPWEAAHVKRLFVRDVRQVVQKISDGSELEVHGGNDAFLTLGFEAEEKNGWKGYGASHTAFRKGSR